MQKPNQIALAQHIVDDAANLLQAVVLAGVGKIDRAQTRTGHGFEKSSVELEVSPGVWVAIQITRVQSSEQQQEAA